MQAQAIVAERLMLKAIYESMFTCFPEAIREDMRKAVHYIEETGTAMGGHPHDWDIKTVFKHPERDSILIDKRAINKRIFERIDQEKRDIPEALVSHEKALLASLEAVYATHLENRRIGLRDAIYGHQREAETCHRQFQEALRYGMDARRKLEACTGKEKTNLSEALSFKNPFWKLSCVSGQQVYFDTQKAVILTQRNSQSGLNLRVNMGFFRARLDVFAGSVSLETLRDNVRVQNHYFHPYVSGNGAICWGDASQRVIDALLRSDFEAVFGCLETLLSHYVPSATPYASLDQFQEVYNKMNPACAQEAWRVEEEDEEESDEDIAF